MNGIASSRTKLNPREYFAIIGFMLLLVHSLCIFSILISFVKPDLPGINEQSIYAILDEVLGTPVFVVINIVLVSLQFMGVAMVLIAFYKFKIRCRWFCTMMQIVNVMILFFIPPIGIVLAIKINRDLKKEGSSLSFGKGLTDS